MHGWRFGFELVCYPMTDICLRFLDLTDSDFISLIGFSAINIWIKNYGSESKDGRLIKIYDAAGGALGLDFFAEQIYFQFQEFAVFL